MWAMDLVIFIVIACTIPSLEAIKCYTCENPKPNGDCESLQTIVLVECPSGLPTCLTHTDVINGQNITLGFFCVPKEDDNCRDLPSKGQSCYCNKDGCNSPPTEPDHCNNCTCPVCPEFPRKNNGNILFNSMVVVTISALLLMFVHNC